MSSNEHRIQTALTPGRIAVVGASEREGSVGSLVLRNLQHARYAGELYAVNPRHDRVGTLACYDSLSRLPAPPDLVIMASPPRTLPQVALEAAASGAAALLVLSDGFHQAGAQVASWVDDAMARARQSGMRIIGPNCLGILRPAVGLNATRARTEARAGNIGVVSQSGALAAALLDYAQSAGFGFSVLASLGAGVDVDFPDLIDFLALDAQTRSILVYVEAIRHPRRFLSSLRAAASMKPVIVLKAGRRLDAAVAPFGHSGVPAQSDAVFDTALRRTGAIRILRYAQLFSASEALTGGRLPRGPRLAILSNGGGPGNLAADQASDADLVLARLGEDTRAALDAISPGTGAKGNPVDIFADADAPRYAQALGHLLADDGCDGVLLLFAPSARVSAVDVAQAVLPVARAGRKPVVSAWLGEADAAHGRYQLRQAGFAAMRSPDQGVESFSYLAQFVRHRELRLQLPPPIVGDAASSPLQAERARAIVALARAQGRRELGEDEAKSLLAACGIEVAQGHLAESALAAQTIAAQIGYPVVLKVRADGITHKSDVGGVLLGLKTPDEVAIGYELIAERIAQRAPAARFRGVLVQRMVSRRYGRELIIGVVRDPAFGPVISFGMGGIAVEVVRDAALALPPLNRLLAAELIGRTRVAGMLKAFRGMPAVEMESLIDALLRVSELACELPCIARLDINPLLADDNGVIALDARVGIDEGLLAPDPVYSHLAIHPYPKALERSLALHDGSVVLLRPVRPEDAEAQRRFVSRLSDLTLYRRFHAPMRELSPDRLVRFTQIDYDREMAIVAIDGSGPEEEIRGFVQYNRIFGGDQAEFGVAVEDGWQGRGLGFALMEAIESCARERGITRINGFVLADNDAMRGMMVARGYLARRDADDPGVIDFGLPLAAP